MGKEYSPHFWIFVLSFIKDYLNKMHDMFHEQLQQNQTLKNLSYDFKRFVHFSDKTRENSVGVVHSIFVQLKTLN